VHYCACRVGAAACMQTNKQMHACNGQRFFLFMLTVDPPAGDGPFRSPDLQMAFGSACVRAALQRCEKTPPP
jgi:hypothetical protein